MWAADVARGEPGSVDVSSVAGSRCSIHHHGCMVTWVADKHVASCEWACSSPEEGGCARGHCITYVTSWWDLVDLSAALEKAACCATWEEGSRFAHSRKLKWRSLHGGETGWVFVNSANWDPYVECFNTSRSMDAI